MGRQSAVTEETNYTVEKCDICTTGVITDRSAPDDAMASRGYMVLLSDGTADREIEREGNWDEEIHFSRDESHTELPNTQGYIICEECADSYHQYSNTGANFYGTIPRELAQSSGQGSGAKLTMAIVGSFVVLILVLLFVVM